jgi:hypothetical protein
MWWTTDRRRLLGMMGASAATVATGTATRAFVPGPDGRLPGEFEPMGAVWVGDDPTRPDMQTVATRIAAALAPYVPVRLLSTSEEAAAETRDRFAAAGVPLDRVEFLHHPKAPYFIRDYNVFGLDGGGKLTAVDFAWNTYGLPRFWSHRPSGGRRSFLLYCPASPRSAGGARDSNIRHQLCSTGTTTRRRTFASPDVSSIQKELRMHGWKTLTAASLGVFVVAGCSTLSREDYEIVSASPSAITLSYKGSENIAAGRAQDHCAANGRRAQLARVTSDGDRRLAMYDCVV